MCICVCVCVCMCGRARAPLSRGEGGGKWVIVGDQCHTANLTHHSHPTPLFEQDGNRAVDLARMEGHEACEALLKEAMEKVIIAYMLRWCPLHLASVCMATDLGH